MSWWSYIKEGLQWGFRYRRIAGYILLIQVLLSAFIGVLAYTYVEDAIGNTTQLMKIIDGYDHDVFQDLLLFESTGWQMIKVFSWVVIALYLLIGPFIMGGLLQAYREQKDRWEVFWRGGSGYYFPFLKINGIIALFFLLIAGGLGGVAGAFLYYGFQHFLTELPVLFAVVLLIVLLFLIGVLLVSISTRAKWELLTQKEQKVWSAFKSSTLLIRRGWVGYLLTGVFFLILTLSFTVLINYLINSIRESNVVFVLLALVLQVFALFVRVCIRNAYYAAILHLRQK